MVYHKQHLEFKEWLSKIPATGNSVLFKNYLNSIYVYWKKEYLTFKNLTLQGFYNVLGFTSLELYYLHWHGVPACPQIPPP